MHVSVFSSKVCVRVAFPVIVLVMLLLFMLFSGVFKLLLSKH